MAAVDPKLHRPYRWAVLLAYVGVMAVQQMLWLNLAPVLLQIQSKYGVSELTASALILVFPLLYVFLSAPAGAMVDARGWRYTVAVGAVATAAAAVLRVFDGSFFMLFAGQVGIALAQPFVVNGISKLVADWFDEAQGAIATGLGTMGMFVGMAFGMAATPPLVTALGLSMTMLVFFGIAAVAAVFFVLVARNNHPPETLRDGNADSNFRPVLKVRGIWPLLGVSFVGLGAFNGLTTWIEAILEPQGIDSEKAGMIGGVIIAGGIVGAVLVPLASDLLKRRKPFLIACAALAAVAMAVVGTEHDYGMLLGVGAALGFVLLPAFALLLDMSANLAGAARAGAATGLVMLFGNAGGVVVILLVPGVRALGFSYGVVVAMLAALVAVGAVFALLPPETFPGAAAVAAREEAAAAARRANEPG
jgi:predicted MFS family arabinose efflux permease